MPDLNKVWGFCKCRLEKITVQNSLSKVFLKIMYLKMAHLKETEIRKFKYRASMFYGWTRERKLSKKIEFAINYMPVCLQLAKEDVFFCLAFLKTVTQD